ncbi:MAG: hypothetical protein IAG13_26250 [Deltaproteobacteria bacterium]|nr:hypothetical protein [Nannocystaceae bacterium]
MTDRPRTRWRAPLVLAAALPMLGGAGTCGILFDLWSWDEITESADSIDIDVEEGRQEIAGYPRRNIWLQRHVYAFEGSLGDAEFGVADQVFHIVFDCDGPATCFADHWLEVPDDIPVRLALQQGSVSLYGLNGPVELEVGEGVIDGDDLGSLDFQLEGDELGEVSLNWLVVPESISIELARAQVTLALPPGEYDCDVPADAEIDPSVVCVDGAAALLHVELQRGTLTVVPPP